MIVDKPFASKSSYFTDESHAFKMAISTNNHLGFSFNHPIRKNDSFDALEEVLKQSRQNNVDLLLLCGNLFHESAPCQEILHKSIGLLKDHIFGDKPINFEVLWGKQAPNYACENMNIDLPIFVIHGKKEALPTNNSMSVLDVLQAGNYLNYFGRLTMKEPVEVIEVSPLLIHKGETKVSLYGIGYMRRTLFQENWDKNRFKFLKKENYEEYFNILVLHQDSSIPLQKNPESSFFNLIIWASDSQSIPKIIFEEEVGYNFYKPGSSIITSFDETENSAKHLGILNIRRKDMQLEPIFLQESRRELIMKEIEKKQMTKINEKMSEEVKKNFKGFQEDELENLIDSEIQNLLKEYHSRVFDQEIKKLPLIRLKVEYSGFDAVRINRLENKYKNKVANGGEILKFWRQKNNASALEIVQSNINLYENFEQCFKAKMSFNSIGKEAVSDLRRLYEKDLSENTFRLMPPSLFLEKIDHLNFRNRNSYFSEFFLQTISKISSELIYDEKSDMFVLSSKYNQKNSYIMKKFKNALTSAALKRQNRNEASIIETEQLDVDESLENFDYQEEMKTFFENIRGGGLSSKAVALVSKVFKEFGAKDFDKLVQIETTKTSNNISNNITEDLEEKTIKQTKKSTSLKTLLKDHAIPKGVRKRGRPRKIDRELQLEGGRREEKSNGGLEEEDNRKENREKGIGQRLKEFIVDEEKKDEEDLNSEKNQKKRKINEKAQFTEFLENIEETEGSNKKKKFGKTFI